MASHVFSLVVLALLDWMREFISMSQEPVQLGICMDNWRMYLVLTVRILAVLTRTHGTIYLWFGGMGESIMIFITMAQHRVLLQPVILPV